MFVYRGGFCKPLATVLTLLACLLALGCGSGDDSTDSATESGAVDETRSGQQPPAGGPTGEDPDVADADPEAVEVITGWVDTLSAGDAEGAAEFFAVPSVAENGVRIEIRSTADAVLFNETLPCGAELTAAETVGEFTTATFRLFERPGGDCGAETGGEASTSFVIEDGKIVEWRRVGAGAPGQAPPEAQTSTT
jgi:hypothetical protein